jgi:hypothetical protein
VSAGVAPPGAGPAGVITGLVCGVEHALVADQVREVVISTVGGLPAQGYLARALTASPQVLVTGRPPPALWSAGQLLLALHAAGAQDVAWPRCGGCGCELRSLRFLRGQGWGCPPCTANVQPCAGCGQPRRVITRDRHGQPRCDRCPDISGDPLAALVQLTAAVDPAADKNLVAAAVQAAVARPSGQRRLAWDIEADPGLLTGSGTTVPSRAVLRFLGALAAAGAAKIVLPACPGCGQDKPLARLVDGVRVCDGCGRRGYRRGSPVPCTRCGRVRPPAGRDASGKPLCSRCCPRTRTPARVEECTGCGNRRQVAVRAPEGPRCAACSPRPVATCGFCGRTAPCAISRATGRPWCARCQHRWARCSNCGIPAQVHGGSYTAPLCARCLNPDPGFWSRCPDCGQTWMLSPRTCNRCILSQRISELTGDGTGQLRPGLTALRQALTSAERPDLILDWLSRSKVRTILATIGRSGQPLTHDLLDQLPPTKTLAHVRDVLVASGSLPARDEHLTRLEQQAAAMIAARPDAAGQRILHGYAVWHHLRRLRGRLAGQHASFEQARNVRRHITAAASFLDWLTACGLTLATCTQPDLDQWATTDTRLRDATAHFVRWAVAHRHASALTFPATCWDGPRGPHDTERRWEQARRLLHDTPLNPSDRVAGLLLLLYAQPVAAIQRLTINDLHDNSGQLRITLGAVPVDLPEPLAGLVRDLAASRRGHSLLDAPAATPWLFPGGNPGQPVSTGHLGKRLHRIGLSPRQDRSTALFTLAAELPAALLARMLGIDIQAAIRWQHAAAGDWMTYAADISRRRSSNPSPTADFSP